MSSSIDLIPLEEKASQIEGRFVKAGTVVTLAIFVITAIFTGYLLYVTGKLKRESASLDLNISRHRSEIKDLAVIEISARNLDAKYDTLKSIMQSRLYYSTLLSELEKRLPSSVDIESLGVGSENKLSVSGTGTDYISISKFINTLTNQEFSSAGEGLGDLFSNVTLNSVSLDQQTTRAKYFMVVDINLDLLKR
ncbi:hypothetical protein HYW61_00085 [candidate division WWE3 bacterium]|nr:hypothetical protein [candidate division WWE3 bacterium]